MWRRNGASPRRWVPGQRSVRGRSDQLQLTCGKWLKLKSNCGAHHVLRALRGVDPTAASAANVEERIIWEWIQVGGVHRQLRVSGLWGAEVREPGVEVCFQTIIEHRDPSLQQPLRPADRPAHLLALRHPPVDDVVHDGLGRGCGVALPASLGSVVVHDDCPIFLTNASSRLAVPRAVSAAEA